MKKPNHSNLKSESLLLFRGDWEKDISWEFYLSDRLPERKLCSAVFGLVIHDSKIVLTKTRRGQH